VGTIFISQLRLCPKTTLRRYIDDLDSADNTDDSHQGNPPSILCLVEEVKPAWAEDGRATIGLISVTPSTGQCNLAYTPARLLIPFTGDIMYDQFEGMVYGFILSCTRLTALCRHSDS